MSIPKGLKVGDTFDDGGMTYKVTGLVGDRYISTWTGAISSKELFAEQPKEKPVEVKTDEEKIDYLSTPYAQLKKMCADRGLDATGKKEDLIARLEG